MANTPRHSCNILTLIVVSVASAPRCACAKRRTQTSWRIKPREHETATTSHPAVSGERPLAFVGVHGAINRSDENLFGCLLDNNCFPSLEVRWGLGTMGTNTGLICVWSGHRSCDWQPHWLCRLPQLLYGASKHSSLADTGQASEGGLLVCTSLGKSFLSAVSSPFKGSLPVKVHKRFDENDCALF